MNSEYKNLAKSAQTIMSKQSVLDVHKQMLFNVLVM